MKSQKVFRKETMHTEETPFETRVDILAELWLTYRDEPELLDFVQYNDLGLPAAYLINEELVGSPNTRLKAMIDESFDLLIATLKIADTGFSTMDDLFRAWDGEL